MELEIFQESDSETAPALSGRKFRSLWRNAVWSQMEHDGPHISPHCREAMVSLFIFALWICLFPLLEFQGSHLLWNALISDSDFLHFSPGV